MLEIGSLIDGKYKILNEVGHGGMSVVYLAMNERANKQWAIKEVRKDGVKDFEVVKQSLVAETNMLKKLSHPSLSLIHISEPTRLRRNSYATFLGICTHRTRQSYIVI